MNKHMIRKQSLFDSKSFRAKCCKIMVLFFLQTFGEMNLQLRGYGRPDQVYAMEARTSQLPGYFSACMHPQFWVDADTLHRGVLPCRKQRPVQGWERSHVHRLDYGKSTCENGWKSAELMEFIPEHLGTSQGDF